MKCGEARGFLSGCKRIVVKVGTSSLTHEAGKLNYQFIDRFARDIADALNADSERRLVFVTSGAVAAGMAAVNITEKPGNINTLQALSSLGQNSLMQNYSRAFGEYQYMVSQLLLTKEVMYNKAAFVNARRTLNELFSSYGNVIPIVNENDAISIDGIKFGDNDTLAAHTAALIEADLLIIISDVDGIYTADPHLNPGVSKLDIIEEVGIDTLKFVSPSKSKLGTGGMTTKLKAAQIANKAAIPMVLASYKSIDGEYAKAYLINEILSGANIGTLFTPAREAFNQRKHWLAFGGKDSGSIKINSGAENAVIHNKTSLLPSGITDVEGEFEKDDIVFILNEEGEKIAKGISEYSAADIMKIKGRQSGEIAAILNIDIYSDEVVNRTNMVTMNYL
ncbi:MAG: glutamate 5-kinase [Oscillospiraceae bacterium]|nr:glutamate 5-kinase [Oscillospiraceae bacterium]